MNKKKNRPVLPEFPVIDLEATGNRLYALVANSPYTVKDVADYMNFTTTVAIYKWFRGESLPTMDNFFALSYLLDAPMDELIVPMVFEEVSAPQKNMQNKKAADEKCHTDVFDHNSAA